MTPYRSHNDKAALLKTKSGLKPPSIITSRVRNIALLKHLLRQSLFFFFYTKYL